MSDKINERKHAPLLITPTCAPLSIMAVGNIEKFSKFLEPKGRDDTPTA